MNTLDLIRLLQQYRVAYYEGEALVPDAVYDSLEEDLRNRLPSLKGADLAEAERFFAGVGATSTGKWAKVRHTIPMGSLNKVQTPEEFDAWAPACWMVASEKADGISIGLDYHDGILLRASTRGDGEEGEDITRNVRKMKGVQPVLGSFTGFLRGEIVLKKSDWKAHFPEKANPRNAAAGVAKREDGVGAEHLSVLFYQVLPAGTAWDKETEFDFLVGHKLPCVQWQVVANKKEVQDLYQEYQRKTRAELDYDIDGLVIEVNDAAHREALGSHNHRPKYGIAFKFPHDEKVTTLRGIEWSMGNSGRLTPVALFDAVQLAGATVSRASLANVACIRDLAGGRSGLQVGDQIVVSRRNDVIPKVESVLFLGHGEYLRTPSQCPVCSSSTAMEGEYLVCSNSSCASRLVGDLKVWVDKIGLKGWGDSVLEALCASGRVVIVADLYSLSEKELSELKMEGRRLGSSAATLLAELHAKRSINTRA